MNRLQSLTRAGLFLPVLLAAASATAADVRWQHPAGLVTDQVLTEVREKLATQTWARSVYVARKAVLDRWLAVPAADLQRVFPRKRGNVYHTFSCPADRTRLKFDPFNPARFTCPSCGKEFAPETDAGVYAPEDRYHGTMYDGWICLFFLEAASVAGDMGVVGRIENQDAYFQRGIEILMLHADTIEKLQVRRDPDPQMRVLLTYHREGDNKVLNDLACAYELLRHRMSDGQRTRFETSVLARMYDEIMAEPIYRYEHNNLYQWHRTIVQVGLALEREDLIDWSMGEGPFDPEHQPEHRSIRRLAATHFKPDGAFWEMCSGYHLYPLHAFCELAVLSRNLSAMDPHRFPPQRYDLTHAENPGGRAIRNALHWFMSMAMPDRTMPTVGDSMAPRAGMDDYFTTAEVGYRFFDLKEVGDYARLNRGERTWAALLYGADTIEPGRTRFTSSYLSSGWVSLRNDFQGNRVWVGLNALIPGGSHQHADRLNLLTYSHGKLLALEKATPYNEQVTRVLGTLSPMHNTVTVDAQSARQGEALAGEEVPRVTHFVAGPLVQFARIDGDHVYRGLKRYRRSVALIEDFVVDCFDVAGGTTHDWMVHHTGTAPQLSAATQETGSFEPADWLANGTRHIRRTDGGITWQARWGVDDVTSRLSMAGAPATEVFALETYPVANAVITKDHPACQTLCVRRKSDEPFMAVWDSWKDRPNVVSIEWAAASSPPAACVETRTGRYHVQFGPGTSQTAGVTLETDGVFALFAGKRAVFVGGTRLHVRTDAGTLTLACEKQATVSADHTNGIGPFEISGDIAYDTYGGRDHRRLCPKVEVTVSGDLWSSEIRNTSDRERGQK